MNILLPSREFSSKSNGLVKNISILNNFLSKLGYKVFNEFDSSVSYDYIIQAEFVLSPYTLSCIKDKNPRAKSIHIIYGNRMLGDIENINSNKISINTNHVDEIWVSPQYEISIEYFKTYYNTQNVFILPYIWEPEYINIEPVKFKNKIISILEPNISVSKSCLPAILIVEKQYREQPNSFDFVNVYCSSEFKNSKYFLSWSSNLDIFKNKKVNLLPRVDFNNIFNNSNQVILSHQLMNDLNYIYLESLYFDIPLVHNSATIKKAGYYYPDYDISKGCKQLNLALTHKSNPKIESNLILNQYSTKNPNVIQQYKAMLKRD